MLYTTALYVVCDANGECKGVFVNQDHANKAADYFGAYVTMEFVRTSLPAEVRVLVANEVGDEIV